MSVIKENIKWNLFSKSISVLIKVSAFIFISNFINPELFGKFSFLLTIVSFLLLFVDFGISASSAKHFAERKYNGIKVLKYSASIISISFFLVVLLFCFFESSISTFFKVKLDHYLIYIILLLFSNLNLKFISKSFEGLGYSSKFSRIDVFFGWFPWIFSVLALLIEPNLKSLLIGHTIGYIFLMFISFLAFINHMKNKKFENKQIIKVKSLLNYALPLLVTSAGFYVFKQSDIFLIKYFSSDYDLGLYAFAIKIIEFSLIPAIAIASAVSPFFVKFRNQNLIPKAFSQVLYLLSLIYIPLVIFLFFYSEEFIIYIFDEKYSKSNIILLIYIPFIILKSVATTLSLTLDYLGLAKQRAKFLSIAAIANIVLNLYLIPKYGIIGAAVASQITYFPLIIFYFKSFKRETNTSTTYLLSFIKPIYPFIAIIFLTIIVLKFVFKFQFIYTIILFFIVYVLSMIKSKVFSKAKLNLILSEKNII